MRIGELSRRSGISERMLRYYEHEGLLRPARSASGYRDYDEQDVEAVNRIRMFSKAGLKIESIRILLPCTRGPDARLVPCPEVRAALHRELDKLDEKLRDLMESRQLVAGYLRSLLPTAEAG